MPLNEYQSVTASVVVMPKRIDSQRGAANSREIQPIASTGGADTFLLSPTHREDWQETNLDIHTHIKRLSSRKPVLITRLVNHANDLCAVVHLRQNNQRYELCLSVVSDAGTWQPGFWLNVRLDDTVSLTWCTDHSGEEISAINLQICP